MGTDNQLQQVRAEVSALNPHATLTETVNSELPIDQVLGVSGFDLEMVAERLRNIPAPDHHHHHHHDHDHDHDHGHDHGHVHHHDHHHDHDHDHHHHDHDHDHHHDHSHSLHDASVF